MQILQYLGVYKQFLGKKIYVIFILASIANFSEGIGFLFLLPVVTAFSNPEAGTDTYLGELFSTLLSYVGIDSLAGTIVVVILFFILKGVFTFSAFFVLAKLQGELQKQLRFKFIQGVTNAKYETFLKNDSAFFINIINFLKSIFAQSI